MRNQRKENSRRRAEKSEYDQKILDIARTARVVAGGRRFSFRVTVAIGNHKGKVGIGIGKGQEVASAIGKAVFQAKKCIVIVPISESASISKRVEGKCAAGHVLLKPTREGHGLIAGGPIRIIMELAGVRNLSAKILGRTTNVLNNAKATMEALKKLNSVA